MTSFVVVIERRTGEKEYIGPYRSFKRAEADANARVGCVDEAIIKLRGHKHG